MKTQANNLLFISTLVLALTPAGTAMSSELTRSDCRLFSPSAHSSEKTRTTASGVQWTEAWPNGAWEPAEEFLGYVFVHTLPYA